MRYYLTLLMYIATAFSSLAYDFQQDSFYFNILDNGNVEVTSGDKLYSGDVVVPASVINGGKTYKVEGLGEKSFAECRELHNVILSEGIEYIGATAFGWCDSMEDLTIPRSLILIGSEAFHACTNSKIYISDLEAFCKITCESSPFYRNVADDASLYLNDQLVTSLTLPASLSFVPSMLFRGCNSLIEVDIPEGVKQIESYAFQSCRKLQKVKFPSSLEKIGYEAFGRCFELDNVVIPASVNTLEMYTFANCSNLKNIIWEGYVEKIPNDCFTGCGFETIELPEGVKSLYFYAFSSCQNLRSVKLPSTVNEIREDCFSNCPNLQGVYLSSVIPPDIWTINFDTPLFVPEGTRFNYELIYPTININSYDAGIRTSQISWNTTVNLFSASAESSKNLGESDVYYLSEGDAIRFSIPYEENINVTATASAGELRQIDEDRLYWEYKCGNEAGDITITKSLKRNKLTLLYPGITSYSMEVPSGQTYSATLSSFDGWKINNVRINDDFIHVSSSEGELQLEIPDIKSDVVVSVVLEKSEGEENMIDEIAKNTSVYAVSNRIIIKTSDNDSEVKVFDINGRSIYSGKSREIEVKSGIYIVNFARNTYKLIIE